MSYETRSRGPRPTREAGIQLEPLIDMVFILLIFFMVTTNFQRNTQLEIDRPSGRAVQTADNRALRVVLGKRGELFLDGQPVRPWMLQARLRELLARQRSKTVLLMADRKVETGELVQVIDQCKLAGASEVGVAVDQQQ